MELKQSHLIPERGAQGPRLGRVRPQGQCCRHDSRRSLGLQATEPQPHPWNTGHFTEELISCHTPTLPSKSTL